MIRQRPTSLSHTSQRGGLIRVLSGEWLVDNTDRDSERTKSAYGFFRLLAVMSLFIASFMMLANWQHGKGNLYLRPSDNAIFYESNGKYYYVPYPTTCKNLKVSGAKISTALTIDTLSVPSIYDVVAAGSHCVRKHMSESQRIEPACSDHKCSAVATIYNMVPGGGEKYLLSLVRALQKMGHFVDILVLLGNGCTTVSCVRSTAEAVNVHIDWNRANVRVVDRNSTHLVAGRVYETFITLGNSKIPHFMGGGRTNIYMNQFPFDRQRLITRRDRLILSTYQHIFLNSEYSQDWYLQYTNMTMTAMKSIGLTTPKTTVVYPPVTLQRLARGHSPASPQRQQDVGESENLSASTLLETPREPWIVMTGRFFDDVQGKRHLEAIDAFRTLKALVSRKERLRSAQYRQKQNILRRRGLPMDVVDMSTGDGGEDGALENFREDRLKLYLVGYQMRSLKHKKYTKRVLDAAARVEGVHVQVNIDGSGLQQLMSRSSVVWSLTGGLGSNDNPADAEHFGIAVVEAMGVGNIPILRARGGLQEIVAHNSSHLCSSLQEFAQKTYQTLHASQQTQATLRKWSRSRSELYSDDEFDSRVTKIIRSSNT